MREIERRLVRLEASPLQTGRAKLAAGALCSALTDEELQAVIDAYPLDQAGRAMIEAMTDEELESVIAGAWPARLLEEALKAGVKEEHDA